MVVGLYTQDIKRLTALVAKGLVFKRRQNYTALSSWGYTGMLGIATGNTGSGATFWAYSTFLNLKSPSIWIGGSELV